MRIYIDFDDVICETAKNFSKLAKELFEIEVPYEEIGCFNLQQSFGLNDLQYEQMMVAGHLPDILLSYEETLGASQTINKWVRDGHEVYIVTGRPFDAYEASRKWLDEHNLANVSLFCVDKYGRESFNKDCTYNMTLDKLYDMKFDFAVEDSPVAFEHVKHFENCTIAVFNRPWNVKALLPNDSFIRCEGWEEIDRVLQVKR